MFEVTPDGLITVDAVDFKDEIETAYKKALGSDINTEVHTPEGQLIINDTTLLNTVQSEVVKAINSQNVFTAEDEALTSIGARYGYYRKKESKTVVDVVFYGDNNIVIPSGFLVSDGVNNFETIYESTIANGATYIQCQCVKNGNIPVYKDTVNVIVNNLQGLDSVNNPTNGVAGVDYESDNEFRQRILKNWASIRSKTSFQAIEDNILSLNNVLSVYMQENPTQSTVIKNGLEMPKNSIYISVLGGTNEDIATVLAVQKTTGAEMVGDDNIQYEDSSQNQYDFKIQRAIPLAIKTKITYRKTKYTPSDVEQRIQEQLQEYFNNNLLKIYNVVTSNYVSSGLSGFEFAEILSCEVAKETETTYTNYVQTTVKEYGVVQQFEYEAIEV